MSEKTAETRSSTTEPKPESAGQAEVKDRDLKLEAAQQRVLSESKAIAKELAKQDTAAGQKFVKLGEQCWKFLQKAKAAGYLVRDARGMLEADILEATRVNWSKEITRAIKVYHVHCYFGESALSLPLDMVKALSTCVQEDPKTEEWGIIPRYADAVTKLYARVVNGKGKRLTAEEFRGELNRITNPNASPGAASGPGVTGTRSPAQGVHAREAGEMGADLGRPPIETPVGVRTSPGDAAVAVMATLSLTADQTVACKVLGQRACMEIVLDIMDGYCEGLLQVDDRVQAAADWHYVRAELTKQFLLLDAKFPPKQRKTA